MQELSAISQGGRLLYAEEDLTIWAGTWNIVINEKKW